MNLFTVPFFASCMMFMTICFLVFVIFRYLRYIFSKKRILSKIRQSRNDENTSASGTTLSQAYRKQNIMARFLGRLGTFALQDSAPSYGITRMRFLQAGIQNTNAVFIFWGVKLILAFCLAALFLVAKFRFHIILQPMHTAGIALMLALTGIYLPDIWLKNRTNRRRETLSNSFPDALDLMVVCVEAGVGLDSTFNRVAEEFGMSNRELSQEFSLVTLELRAGKSRQDAMNNLARRTGLDEIKDFAGLMIQTLKFGTSISHALRLYADTFRTNRRQKAEEMAAKIPVKLTIPTALFIFPSLLVVILGPAGIRIAQNFITSGQ